MGGALTRRRFVARGTAALAVLAAPGVARARRGDAKTAPVFRLDPNSQACGGGKGACHACVGHDKNSLFASSKAANGNRAHIGCDCCVVQGTLHYGTYVALFGKPGSLHAYRADLRDARTRTLLKQHPPQFSA